MMPVLNLLDWREAARVQARHSRRRQLQQAVLLALVLGLAGHAGLKQLQVHQQLQQTQARAALQHAQQALQQQRARAEQAARWQQDLSQIEALQGERLALTQWLDALSDPLPETLRWIRLSQEGPHIRLEARSDDRTALGDYLQALQGSPWFTRVQLQSQQAEHLSLLLELRQPTVLPAVLKEAS